MNHADMQMQSKGVNKGVKSALSSYWCKVKGS